MAAAEPLRLLRLWFDVSSPVSRGDYLVSGSSLMVVKYLGEACLLWSTTGQALSPGAFVDPVVAHRVALHSREWTWFLFAWTLPFLWIGLSLSVRRCRDAGWWGWCGALFLLPFVNWVVMLALAIAPSRHVPPPPPPPAESPPPARAAVVLAALASGIAVTAAMLALCVYGLGRYGPTLFVATPVVVGMTSAVIARRYGRMGLGAALGIGQATLALGLLLLVAFALEGVMCVVMAWPLAAVLVLLGGFVGAALTRRPAPVATTVLVAMLSLPLLAWQETAAAPARLREVVTAIDVAAPPAIVWRRVVAFPDLPRPDGIFALGIACPLRARIAGEGVGAVRYCEFTTGDFVEPITVWDPPRRLAFAVTAQPPAMRELSPWPDLHAPHLDGYLRSRRGEFRLHALADGRTRLEGSTWYELEVGPAPYWALWSDGCIHRIHERVLGHIARLAEGDARGR